MRLLTPAVVLIDPKYPHNVAAAIRGCSIFGAKTLLWTGDRVRYDKTLKERLPREERMKGYANVTFMPHQRPIDAFENADSAAAWTNSKTDFTPVCIEIAKGSQPLDTFEHPSNPVYIFGPEDGSVPATIKRHCFYFVHIPAYHCLNLAAAVNVVLYDRIAKRRRDGLEPVNALREHRGPMEAGEIDVEGWEGK